MILFYCFRYLQLDLSREIALLTGRLFNLTANFVLNQLLPAYSAVIFNSGLPLFQKQRYKCIKYL